MNTIGTQYYSGAVTTTLLRDYLMDIFFSREDVNNRKVVALTGEIGAILFHQAVANLASGFLTVDTNYIKSGTNQGATPGLTFGAQFTRYIAPNGLDINLQMVPLYDSELICKKSHPLFPGRPIDSARMTFMNFGSVQNESNVMFLKERNSFTYGYVPGMVGPSGAITGMGMTASLKQGYDVAIQTSAGVVIRDVSQAGELIPEIA